MSRTGTSCLANRMSVALFPLWQESRIGAAPGPVSIRDGTAGHHRWL